MTCRSKHKTGTDTHQLTGVMETHRLYTPSRDGSQETGKLINNKERTQRFKHNVAHEGRTSKWHRIMSKILNHVSISPSGQIWDVPSKGHKCYKSSASLKSGWEESADEKTVSCFHFLNCSTYVSHCHYFVTSSSLQFIRSFGGCLKSQSLCNS